MSKHYVIITKAECPWCEKAKQLLTANKLTYTEFDIADWTAFKHFLYELDAKTVPQIFTKGHWIGGYSDLEEVFAYTSH